MNQQELIIQKFLEIYYLKSRNNFDILKKNFKKLTETLELLEKEDLINIINILISNAGNINRAFFPNKNFVNINLELNNDDETYFVNSILNYDEEKMEQLYIDYFHTYAYYTPFNKLYEDFTSKIFKKYSTIIYERIKKQFKNEYKCFLETNYWQSISKEKMRIADYTCQLCGAKKTTLNTHHSTYDIFGIEVFNMDKLIVLCQNCHSKFHNKEVK